MMYNHGQAGILGIGDAHITYFSSSEPTNMEFVIDTYPSSVERKLDPVQKIDKEAVYEAYALDDGEEDVAAAELMEPKKQVKWSIANEMKDYQQLYGLKMLSKVYRNQICERLVCQSNKSIPGFHNLFIRKKYRRRSGLDALVCGAMILYFDPKRTSVLAGLGELGWMYYLQ
jgi:hypothetical protein